MNTKITSGQAQQLAAEQRGDISSLYILKALACFVVVCCHAPLALPWLQIPGLCVELFFTITGYFLFSAEPTVMQRRIVKTLKKLVPIILGLQLLYNLVIMPPVGYPWQAPFIYVQWLFLGFSTFESGHLWYLTALFLGLIFLYVFIKLFKGKGFVYLLPLVLLWALIGPFRYFLFGKEESLFVFNFLTRAVPYLALGLLLRKWEGRLSAYPWMTIYFILLTLSAGELFLTNYLSAGTHQASLLLLLPLPAVVFILFLQHKSLGQGTFIERLGRDYSSDVYYYHMLFGFFFGRYAKVSPDFSAVYDQVGALMVFFLSLALACLLHLLRPRLKACFRRGPAAA